MAHQRLERDEVTPALTQEPIREAVAKLMER
jgi:hypothetical protein